VRLHFPPDVVRAQAAINANGQVFALRWLRSFVESKQLADLIPDKLTHMVTMMA